MSACAICKKPVVVDPDMLSDGEIVHAGCKYELVDMHPDRTQPKSGSRIRVTRRVRRGA